MNANREQASDRKYFHSFDAFRFFAFFLVFIHHLPFPDTSLFYFFSKSGGIGVSFFFVLSGFLITYILIQEKKKYGKIPLRNFFLRRILRIWPLFYAMLLFAFLTPLILNYLRLSHSDEGYTPNWLVSSLFLENYKMMLTDNFPNVSPLRVMWSLCIEEHFYIIWGLILYFLPIKNVPKLIISSILFAGIVRWVYGVYGLNTIDVFSNIDYFAFGAIPAYIIHEQEDLLHRLSYLPAAVKYFFLFFTLAFVFSIPHVSYVLNNLLNPLLLGSLFSSCLLFTLSHTNGIYIADHNIMSRLGIYTYGLYLYHTIVINLVLQMTKNFKWENHLIFVGSLSLIITIAISFLSYHFFEKKFIGLKKYFYKTT